MKNIISITASLIIFAQPTFGQNLPLAGKLATDDGLSRIKYYCRHGPNGLDCTLTRYDIRYIVNPTNEHEVIQRSNRQFQDLVGNPTQLDHFCSSFLTADNNSYRSNLNNEMSRSARETMASFCRTRSYADWRRLAEFSLQSARQECNITLFSQRPTVSFRNTGAGTTIALGPNKMVTVDAWANIETN